MAFYLHHSLSNINIAGILNEDGTLDNDASIQRLAEVALSYAQAGTSTG